MIDESCEQILRKFEQLKYNLQTELNGLKLQTEINYIKL